MRRRSPVVMVLILLGASLVGPWSTSAHNIDVKKAREVVREYARKVRDESGGKYIHYSTNCVAAFPNHNHIASCQVDYQNAEDTKKGVYTCRELIEVKMWPHRRSPESFVLWVSHTSWNICGSRRLNNEPMN